jgi:D-sedoheptulose 7-phosphate isomerase
MTLTATDVGTAFAARATAGEALAGDAGAVADACHHMAQRFHAGGTLLVFGNGTSATDAAHIAVEFVHPVIVGKRALPAMSLTNDVATVTGIARTGSLDDVFVHQLRLHARPGDIALGLSPDGRCRNVLRALEYAHSRDMLTVAMAGADGGDMIDSPSVDHALRACSDDPLIVKEVQVTSYHILWELVHVFFEQPGILSPEVLA